jgi:hypothetical protein
MTESAGTQIAVHEGEVVQAKRRRAPVRRDQTGAAMALALREMVLEALGLRNPAVLKQIGRVMTEGMDATRTVAVEVLGTNETRAVEVPDHPVRLKAATLAVDLAVPKVHGNSETSEPRKLEIIFPEWLRKQAESRR